MKNITFSADESLIQKAREKAAERSRTLNDEFREWLAQYAQSTTAAQDAADLDELLNRLRHIRLEAPYTRDEMNARR